MRRMFAFAAARPPCGLVRSYHASRAAYRPPTPEDEQAKMRKYREQAGNSPRVNAFDEQHPIDSTYDDRGPQRLERETREKMRRIPRFDGDFSSMEERHILYGRLGTPERPVVVESVFPSRIVGCLGSEETVPHDLLWHVVHHERPTVCLECGQVFKLQLPAGETERWGRHHDHDDHDDHGDHGHSHGHEHKHVEHGQKHVEGKHAH